MGLAALWRRWRESRARRREALHLLAGLFERPDLGRVSSLRPEHRSRAVYLGCETEGGEVRVVRFGMVRHPRPLPMRGVHHDVVEIYAYDVKNGTVDVVSSRNITRKGPPGPG